MHDCRVVTANVEFGDVVPTFAQLDVGSIVHDERVREREIVRGQRRAVGPLDVLAEVQDDRLAVFRDAAVRVGRNFGRKLGEKIAMRIVAKERREEQVADLIGGRRVRVKLEQRIRLVGRTVANVTGQRPRMPSTRAV